MGNGAICYRARPRLYYFPRMKQLVVNLKEFNDIGRRENKYKAVWAIEQTAKGLGIGEATVRRIMAEYNKNK